jgi:hypothetical protein
MQVDTTDKLYETFYGPMPAIWGVKEEFLVAHHAQEAAGGEGTCGVCGTSACGGPGGSCSSGCGSKS